MTVLTGLLKTPRLLGASLLLTAFILYPHINGIFFDMPRWMSRGEALPQTFVWILRFVIMYFLCVFLLYRNVWNLPSYKSKAGRLGYNLAAMLIAWVIFIALSLAVKIHYDCFTGLLLFQFLIAAISTTVIGYVYSMFKEKQRQRHEIETLKYENLQSRCMALTEQINPHFFFNSMNGLTSLIRNDRKEMSLEYVQKLSEIFRYILKSEERPLVTLRDELNFINSFIYMQKVRFGDNFNCRFNIPENCLDNRLPILSLLSLVENVVKHNTIDSENPIDVLFEYNTKGELIVSNHINEKLEEVESSRIGLKNLMSRSRLLTGRPIEYFRNDDCFTVKIPLLA